LYHHHLIKTLPCHGMAWHDLATPLSTHLSTAPPCQSHSTHSPEHPGHEPRSNGAPDTLERDAPIRASDAHTRARARTANATGTPRHVDVPLACVTSSSPLCATSSATSPRTSQTSPLARGNAVVDDLVDDHHHGTEHSLHAPVLVSPSFSPPSSPASPPWHRLHACVIASPSSSM
jgi:hypothetical protein